MLHVEIVSESKFSAIKLMYVCSGNWALWAERVLVLAVAQYSEGTVSAIELTFYACSLVLVNAFKVSL